MSDSNEDLYKGPRRTAWRKDRANAVGRVLGARLDQLGIGDKVRQHTAPLIWAEMVGPQIAGVTEAERVHDGVLHVATKSAPWASELNFHKADILRRLNERVGARAGKPLISDIRFYNRGNTTKKPILETAPSLYPTRAELEDIELSASDKAQIEADVAVVTDEKLRDRLRRARMAGLRLQTWRMENGWCPCDICGELAPPRFPYDGTLDCLSCRMKRVASRRPTEGRI